MLGIKDRNADTWYFISKNELLELKRRSPLQIGNFFWEWNEFYYGFLDAKISKKTLEKFTGQYNKSKNLQTLFISFSQIPQLEQENYLEFKKINEGHQKLYLIRDKSLLIKNPTDLQKYQEAKTLVEQLNILNFKPFSRSD